MGYINKECKSYPCHKELEDCTYCYCHIYPCECSSSGKWLILTDEYKTRIWDCSDCEIFHKKIMIDFLEIVKEEAVKSALEEIEYDGKS